MSYFVENAAAFGVIVTGLGVIVTVVLFLVQSRRQRIQARLVARQELVSRVLDTIERASRAYALYPLSRLWTRSEMEIVLVLPRLVLELDSQDRDVAVWVARQVQLMQMETSDKGAVKIAQAIGIQLAEWHHGTRSLQWFTSELAKSPYDPNFTAPRANRAKRWLRQFRDTGSLLGGIAVLRWAWRFASER